jgi:hypothetical protein
VTRPRSTRPPGPRVAPRAAADLAGIPRPELEDLIRRSVVRTERIGGRLFLDRDDAEHAAQGWENGG